MEFEHSIGCSIGDNLIKWHPVETSRFIAVAGAQGSALLLGDVSDTHNQQFLKGHDEAVSALAVSPSGKMIASGQLASSSAPGDCAPVLVWDYETRTVLFQLDGLTFGVKRLAFSPDNKYLAASGEDGVFFIWKLQTGEQIVGKKFHKPVTCIFWGAVDRDTRRPDYVVVTAHSNHVFVNTLKFDVRAMEYLMSTQVCSLPSTGLVRDYCCVRRLGGPSSDVFFQGTFSPAGESIIVGTTSGELVIFNYKSLVYRAIIPLCKHGLHAVVNCEAKPQLGIFIAGGDGTIKRLTGKDSVWAEQSCIEVDSMVVGLTINEAGDALLASSSAGTMYRIDLPDGKAEIIGEGHCASVNAVAFSIRSDVFATISTDSTLKVWDLSTYKALVSCKVAGGAIGNCLEWEAIDPLEKEAISESLPPKQAIFSGWSDGCLRCHDAFSGKELWALVAHGGDITSIASSVECIYTGGRDCKVNVWSKTTRELLAQFADHRAPVTGVCTDLNDKACFHSCGEDRACYMYDMRRGCRVTGHTVGKGLSGVFTSISQTCLGEQEIATSTADGQILLWDADIIEEPVGMMKVTADGETGGLVIRSIAFSSSGDFLSVGTTSGLVGIFWLSKSTKEMFASEKVHACEVKSVAWSSDERQIVSVGVDGMVAVWNVFKEEEEEFEEPVEEDFPASP